MVDLHMFLKVLMPIYNMSIIKKFKKNRIRSYKHFSKRHYYEQLLFFNGLLKFKFLVPYMLSCVSSPQLFLVKISGQYLKYSRHNGQKCEKVRLIIELPLGSTFRPLKSPKYFVHMAQSYMFLKVLFMIFKKCIIKKFKKNRVQRYEHFS